MLQDTADQKFFHIILSMRSHKKKNCLGHKTLGSTKFKTKTLQLMSNYTKISTKRVFLSLQLHSLTKKSPYCGYRSGKVSRKRDGKGLPVIDVVNLDEEVSHI